MLSRVPRAGKVGMLSIDFGLHSMNAPAFRQNSVALNDYLKVLMSHNLNSLRLNGG